jgi:hypothetical protein
VVGNHKAVEWRNQGRRRRAPGGPACRSAHGRRLCRSGNGGSGIREWVLHVASASRREIRWTGPQQSAQGIRLKTAVELAAAISRDQCPWIPPGPSAARPRVPSCSADGSPQGPAQSSSCPAPVQRQHRMYRQVLGARQRLDPACRTAHRYSAAPLISTTRTRPSGHQHNSTANERAQRTTCSQCSRAWPMPGCHYSAMDILCRCIACAVVPRPGTSCMPVVLSDLAMSCTSSVRYKHHVNGSTALPALPGLAAPSVWQPARRADSTYTDSDSQTDALAPHTPDLHLHPHPRCLAALI